MITCVSERSGMASTGVRASAKTPHPVTNTVARRTRKRLAIDQRMRAAIMSALPHGLDLVLARGRLHEIERDLRALRHARRRTPLRQLEVHRHRAPLERRDRAVRKGHAVL